MGNKRDPRTVTVTDEPTLLTELSTRKGVIFLNGDNPIKLHRRGTDDNGDPVTFASGYPLGANKPWGDTLSWDAYYAICDTGLESEVVIWETE